MDNKSILIMKEYLIYKRDVTLVTGKVVTKFFIKYMTNGVDDSMEEFWGLTLDEHVSVVKDGYLKHKDSF